MRTYSELIEVMTIQQRLKRSISSKKVARKAAVKRKLAMKKPPTQEKINKAIDRQVRQKALSIADKTHVYKTAEAGVKANIEKKASKILVKKRALWTKKLRPEVTKAMKDAYKSRMGHKNPEAS
jgi:hypothetical protein